MAYRLGRGACPRMSLAPLMLASGAWHVVHIAGTHRGRGFVRDIFPRARDLADAARLTGWNMGLLRRRPLFGRFSYIEKAEYWALIWGILIMALTGFMMWNQLATIQILPGEFIPAAKTAHGAEAILAVLEITVWNMDGWHDTPVSISMWYGSLPRGAGP